MVRAYVFNVKLLKQVTLSHVVLIPISQLTRNNPMKFLLRILLIISVALICVFIYAKYIRQEYNVCFYSMEKNIYYNSSQSRRTYDRTGVRFISRCFKLKYSFKEIENQLGGFPSCSSIVRPPQPWSDTEPLYDTVESLCAKNIYSWFRKKAIYVKESEAKYTCDYFSPNEGICLRSPFLGLRPTEGTYMIHGDYYEITDNGWKHLIPHYNNDEPYEYLLYKSKDETKKITELNESDFYFLHKKKIHEPEIETLPFGTYMMVSKPADGHRIYYLVVSITKSS